MPLRIMGHENRRSGLPDISAARWVMFAAGVLFLGVGISMITKSGLGTSAVTSFSYVLSCILPPSLGVFVFLVNLTMVAVQVLLLRRDFHRWMLLQIPGTVLFSLSIDLCMETFQFLEFQAYWQRLLFLLAGCAVFSCGIAWEVTADVVVLPAEAVVVAIAKVTHAHFGTVKTALDLGMVAAASALSLLFLQSLQGVGVGTVLCALLVGNLSRFFLRCFGRRQDRPHPRQEAR